MGVFARMMARLVTRSAPPAWLSPYYLMQLGGGWWTSTLSGEAVTPGRAQSQATVYSCLGLISGALASPDWDIVREAAGGTSPDDTTPEARALDTLDFAEREAVVWDCWASGNGFIRIWRSTTGQAGELERLVASQMMIKADSAGNASYAYLDPYAGRTVELGASDLIHIRCRTLGLWPIVGIPPLLTCRDTIGLAPALDTYKNRALANGSAVTGYLSTDGKIDRQKAEDIRKRWNDAYAGGLNAGGVPVLEQGLKFNSVSMQSLVDLQMAEASKIAATEVAKLFNVPPVAIGEVGSVNRASAQTEMEALYRLCLFPAATRIADQVARQLLPPASRASGYDVQIDLEAWLRGSGASLADMLSKLVLAGISTPDEARGFIGLPAAANGDGASLLRPVNMAEANQPAVGSVPPADLLPAAAPADFARALEAECERRLQLWTAA
jgi:HK97 family phage portal protein